MTQTPADGDRTRASDGAGRTTRAVRRRYGAAGTVAALIAVIALAASALSLVPGSDASAAPPPLEGFERIVFTGDPALERNFIVTRAGDPTRVVAESGWTKAQSWAPDTALLDPGAHYDAYVVAGPDVADGAVRYAVPDESGMFSDDPMHRDPTVLGWSVVQGPERIQAPWAGAARAAGADAAPSGLRARFWPHFSPEAVTEEFEASVDPEETTKPMPLPDWSVTNRIEELGLHFMYFRSYPEPPADTQNKFHNWVIDHWKAFEWGVGGFMQELMLTVGWAGCKAVNWLGSGFGAKPIDCEQKLQREHELRFDVEIGLSIHDDGSHVLWNTNGTNVEAAAETFVGQSGSTGGGFEYDWTESIAGMFPLLSGYSTKMLGYLEVDPDDVTVDEDGYVELTFGVKGPAGAQAWIEGVGATKETPGQRVQLGSDDALAAEPFVMTERAASWTFVPFELQLMPGETEEQRERRLMGKGIGRFKDDIEATQEAIVDAAFDTPPMDKPAMGDTVRIKAGAKYPLTLLAWSAFVPGTAGLYVDLGDGAEPVPLDWLTPAPEGTTGFNDPVHHDGVLTAAAEAHDFAISADGSHIVQLSDEGLTTATHQLDGTWDEADPITVEGDRLGTIGQTDAESLDHWPHHISLDNRVAINSDGTIIAAAADTIGGATKPEVVIAETTALWLPFDDAQAVVTALSDVLAASGADPFRTQDGTLQSRNLAMSASGHELAVSEVWLADPDGVSPTVLPGTAGSRVMVFQRDDNGDWSLLEDITPDETLDVGSTVTATASDGAHLWMANEGSTNLVQIDNATGRTLATIDVGIEPAALATDGHAVVAIAADGVIVTVDIRTRTPADPVSTSTIADPADAKIVGGDLFVANAATTNPAPLATRIELATGATLASYGNTRLDHRGTYTIWGGRFALPNLTVDDASRVWVSQPAGSRLHRIDPIDDSMTSMNLGRGAAEIAFDGTHIVVTHAIRVWPWVDHTNPDKMTYELAARIFPDTMQLWAPVTIQTDPGISFNHFAAPLAADPVTSTVYMAVLMGGVPVVLTVDTSTAPPLITDPGRHALDLDVSPGVAMYLPPFDMTGWAPPATSLDVVGGHIWVSARDHDTGSAQLAAVAPSAMAAKGYGGGQVGAHLDVFGASVDIAADPDGVVALAITTPSGFAVYTVEPDGLSKTLAGPTLATSVVSHNNAVALADDAQTLFVSEPATPDKPGRLAVYGADDGYWELRFHLMPPYDDTSDYAEPVGGKVQVQGQFLTLTGSGNELEPAPVWVFRDVFGGWSEFKTWSRLTHPDFASQAPGSGNVEAIAGGRTWAQPMALVGHRPHDGYFTPMGGQYPTQPFWTVLTYTDLPLSVSSEEG